MSVVVSTITRVAVARRTWILASSAVCVWSALAYALLPLAWRHYEHQSGLADKSMVTVTPLGIPGDPINVGFVGDERDIVCAFAAAGWSPADPVTLASSLKIVGSVILDRPYPDAPVSPLLYDGRREDLAFQKPEGRSADRRHHVRLWKTLDSGAEQRPVWLGAASFDRGVGVSRYTLQVTHHIDADLDAERDLIGANLTDAGVVDDIYFVTGVSMTINGRNGGGDRYFTDGEVMIARLSPDCAKTGAPPQTLPNPPAVDMKNSIWRTLRRFL